MAAAKFFLLLVVIAVAAPAGAVRANASASIVDCASVSAQPARGSLAVSVTTVSAVPYAFVTVAFN
jgi:hypothetical protein